MSKINYISCSETMLNDPILAPNQQFITVREEFDPSNFYHRQALLKFIETGLWVKNIDIHGSFNVPYDCMRKMAYYACKFDATQ